MGVSRLVIKAPVSPSKNGATCHLGSLTPSTSVTPSTSDPKYFSFTSLCTVARQNYLDLFRRLESAGVREVVFCGVDEVAEVAYLSLQETGLKLVAVMDDERSGDVFFGVPVISLAKGVLQMSTPLVISSLKRKDELLQVLHGLGVTGGGIFVAGDVG